MDRAFVLTRLRGLRRHVEGFGRGLAGRVDTLLTARPSKGDRGELDFLTKTLQPPYDKLAEDLKELEKLIEQE